MKLAREIHFTYMNIISPNSKNELKILNPLL